MIRFLLFTMTQEADRVSLHV